MKYTTENLKDSFFCDEYCDGEYIGTIHVGRDEERNDLFWSGIDTTDPDYDSFMDTSGSVSEDIVLKELNEGTWIIIPDVEGFISSNGMYPDDDD